MVNKPFLYFDYLGFSSQMQRVLWETTLMYKQSKRKEFTLYDKGAEVKANKGKSIAGNLLRVELKQTKNLASQMKQDIITAVDLCDVGFFNELIVKWISEYDKIEKIKPIVDFVGVSQTSTVKATMDCIFAGFIAKECQSNPLFLSQQIDTIKRLDLYSNSSYNRQIKDKIEKLLDTYSVRQRSDLEQELSYKIRSVQKA